MFITSLLKGLFRLKRSTLSLFLQQPAGVPRHGGGGSSGARVGGVPLRSASSGAVTRSASGRELAREPGAPTRSNLPGKPLGGGDISWNVVVPGASWDPPKAGL